MKTSEFLNALRARPELPLAFSTEHGTVPAGYHLTEVRRVANSSVDCGTKTHSWTENHFELLAPRDAAPDRTAMRAGKFLSIVDKVRTTLPLDDGAEARVFGSVNGGPDQLHSVTSIETGAVSIIVHLEPVTARCKPAQTNTSTQCCTMAADSKIGALCGCAAKPVPPVDLRAIGLSRVESMWFAPFESQGIRFMF